MFFQHIITVIMCVVCLVLQPACAEPVYSPRDFVSSAPAELFYTEDEMSEEEKRVLVRGGFKKKVKFDCSAWGVAAESSDRIVLQYCADSFVVVHVFRGLRDPKSALVAVSSVRASGRASDLTMFRASKGQKEFAPLTQQQLAELGVRELTENDFLKEAQRFSPGEAQPVRLALSDSGELHGELMTWMDPRWEDREQAYEVAFVWRQGSFEQVKRDISGK
jgi:hypothetical protein